MIVSFKDDRSAIDNSAIAQIAKPDLSEDTLHLINKNYDNDDAIFFLGRLVWQGEMASCIAPFIDITVDNSRDIYTRRVSVHAVMTCGSIEQKQRMWQRLNKSDTQLPLELLADLIKEAEPDCHSVEQLVISLGKLPPYESYRGGGLVDALNSYIKRFTVINGHNDIVQLLDGLNSYLDKQPFVVPGECHVSKEYAWLLSPATHAVERLIVAQNTVALGETSLSILLKVPALRFWSGSDFIKHKDNLKTLVPDWPKLNDALYWASIEQARIAKAEKSGEPLTDDWSVSWLGHFWAFDMESLPRLLDFIRSRVLLDDRLVALSTAFAVYMRADKPSHILTCLHDFVADDQMLRDQLEFLLNPPLSETMQKQEAEHAERQRKQDEKKKLKKQARDTWIAKLCADADRVRNPPNLKPGEISDDQCRLMRELENSRSVMKRSAYANWQALIPDFTEAVAHAYRDAAVKHWRLFMPKLGSEGGQKNSVPFALIFALAGLEIEAIENTMFPSNLDEKQVRHALRYITWELNGFPCWLETLHQAFPDLVKGTVITELLWELENTGPNNPMHFLSDVVYHAPWLHQAIAPSLLEWVEANPTRINTNRHYCLQIFANGGTDQDRLAGLARQQISQTNDLDSIPWWYALKVVCEPVNGIPEVEKWLSSLEEKEATPAALRFVTALIGGLYVGESGLDTRHFREPENLKSLYILMHRYIQAKEDIDHANGCVYSKELRDDAQDARNRLFSLLSEIPGKASYTVIKQLIHEHPDPDYRPWMAKHAYKRAEKDGDLKPWTPEQVSEFNKSQIITPTTHRQLFDLSVYRLLDLKNWLERGNDSPWKTWKRTNKENEMRTLIAGWLNQQCREQYTTAQEPELANSQRMDIWLHNTKVSSPVPIEIKILDKGWSGPGLCERLRNQLAGDYLREETAGCGIMLLVWQGRKPENEKRWRINGRLVGLPELASALKLYWYSIEKDFIGVDKIDVIVIDLTIRAQVRDS
ncbi:MAG: hypothetical protein ABIK28_15090 [Planctomycetota bacterium]